MITDIIVISLIVVLMIDTNDFMQRIKKMIWKFTFKNKPYKDFDLKPLDCSYCMIWWTNLIWLIINNSVTLPLILVILTCSFFSPVFLTVYQLVSDFILKLVDEIYRYFGL